MKKLRGLNFGKKIILKWGSLNLDKHFIILIFCYFMIYYIILVPLNTVKIFNQAEVILKKKIHLLKLIKFKEAV